MLKIIVPSYRRAANQKTVSLLQKFGWPFFLVLHDQAERYEYLKANPSLEPFVHVSGQPSGISNQRRWVLDNLVEKNEWFVTMDDNVVEFRGVESSRYSEFSLPVQDNGFDARVFNSLLSGEELLRRFEADIAFCDRLGIHYAGFATVPNYYFLGKKYRFVGYVISKVALIHHVGVEYDPMVQAMDDYAFTAEHLLKFGNVLINNWIIPKAGHYESGGIGTYEERVPKKRHDCEYLMQKYPGLFRYKIKKGCDPLSELQVRFTSSEQVESWRRRFVRRA